MDKEIVIKDTNQLFQLIKDIRAHSISKDTRIRFEGGPKLELSIHGERFHGGFPTRLMPTFVMLQKTIDDAYVKNAYVFDKRISQAERKQTELIVRTKPGSTKFLTSFGNVFNSAIANMSGFESMVTILGSALIIGGVFIWKHKITKESEIRKHELENSKQVRMSELEKEKMQVVTELARESKSISSTLQKMDETQTEILKRLEPLDKLGVNGDYLINGVDGNALSRTPRRESVIDHIEGVFKILSIDSGSVEHGFKMKVVNVNTGQELRVEVHEDYLPVDQIKDLQNCEWEKRPLFMQIKLVRAGEGIKKASLRNAVLYH